jgi:hypothetical protein
LKLLPDFRPNILVGRIEQAQFRFKRVSVFDRELRFIDFPRPTGERWESRSVTANRRLLSLFGIAKPLITSGILPSGGIPDIRILQPIQPARRAFNASGFLSSMALGVISAWWIATRLAIFQVAVYWSNRKLGTVEVFIRRIIDA